MNDDHANGDTGGSRGWQWRSWCLTAGVIAVGLTVLVLLILVIGLASIVLMLAMGGGL